MRATGTFTVSGFRPAALEIEEPVETALPTGVALMEKHFSGEVSGRSTTIFTSAFDPATGVGTYVALESFAGALGEVEGTFNFVHGASTSGADRTDEHFLIVPSSGTGGLDAIRGVGGIVVDADRHEIWFDYELDQ